MERKSFLDQEAPAGYVAGSARGAVDFRFTSTLNGFNRKVTVVTEDDDEEEGEVGDHAGGTDNGANEKGILVKSKRNEEDEEADKIYEEIERKLSAKKASSNDTVQQTTNKPQFSDLKRQLANLTEDDWLNLPEPGDITRRNKRMRLLEQQQQRMYSAPDTLIAGSSGTNGSTTNFKSLSESRDQYLSSQLDNLLPKKETTSTDSHLQESILSMSGVEQDVKYADLQKSRIILSSLRKTEPFKPSSWIQSARLEEQNKNLKLAKNYILEGCKKCPKNDEIWLENIRLNESDLKLCKQLVNTALGYVPKSEKLWIKAMNLEIEPFNKRKVIMKSLENLPNSSKLWKLLIDLETDQDIAKKLLGKATEMCPLVWEFWLGLINLSNYEDSKKLLNQARKKLTGDPKVWIAACKLEEGEQGAIEVSKLTKLMDKAMKESSSKTVTKDEWYEFAIDAEREEFTKTSKAIVASYLNSNKGNITDTSLLEDVDKFFTNGHIVVGRSILDYLIDSRPNDVSNWRKLITSIKKFNDLEVLFSYYTKAIDLNPQTPLFYLMFAKDKWQLGNDIPEARSILNCAAKKIPHDLTIKFAIIKLDMKSGNITDAKEYIKTIIDSSPLESEKFWYKYVHILRCLKDSEVLEFSTKALKLFPDSWKLYLQQIQILQDDLHKLEQARELASIAVKKCHQIPQLWIKLSEIDQQLGIIIRARAVIDQAMLKNPESPMLWTYKIQFEKKNQDLVAARNISNKSLKKFPSDANLWIEYLWLLPKMSQRKTAFLDALKATDNSSLILNTIGVFFWYDGKYNKCKNWFERSLLLDKNNGDAWGWMYVYLKKFGTKQEVEKFIKGYETMFDGINKGKVFNVVNKSIENYNKSPREILEITADSLSNNITTTTTTTITSSI